MTKTLDFDKDKLEKEADKLLLQNGFERTGESRKKICRKQRFFERRLRRTPMGHKK